MTLTPTYNRDYSSKKKVLEDFLADKDFNRQPEDQTINRPQIEEAGVVEVNVRYKQLTRVVVLKRTGETWNPT